jgi:hypothetical protein
VHAPRLRSRKQVAHAHARNRKRHVLVPIPHQLRNKGIGAPRRWRAACRRGGVSQKTVQLVIGRLVTDEDFRLAFIEQPLDTLAELREQGLELTRDEVEALIHSDRRIWPSMARRIHPRLQRCSLRSA